MGVTLGGAGATFFPGYRAYEPVIAPALAVTVNNWNFPGLATAILVRFSAPFGGHSVSGIVGGVPGRELILHNFGANAVTFLAENAGSLALNRLVPVGAVNFTHNGQIIISWLFDETVQRWRQMS